MLFVNLWYLRIILSFSIKVYSIIAVATPERSLWVSPEPYEEEQAWKINRYEHTLSIVIHFHQFV